MKSGKISSHKISYIFLFLMIIFTCNAQKEGIQSITISDLESHLYFLASDELQGRETGEPGLEIAANYLASQAKKIGLKAVDDNNDYFQKYIIEENSWDPEKSLISISSPAKDTIKMEEDFYMIVPPVFEDLDISGEVVFAGYGVNSEKYNYNDFNEVEVSDKVVLIMDRAPMDESGVKPKFDDYDWNNLQSFNYKYFYINTLKPKAILIVFDPKSGFNCLSDVNPAFPKYFASSKKLKDTTDPYAFVYNLATKVFIIHRNVADKLLEGTGMDLQTLQNKIDESLEPHSFPIPGKTINIHLKVDRKEITVRNIFGIVEGADPVLKNEYIIYLAHYDHVGTDLTGDVYNGADDNASGSTALLEMAEAFMLEKNKIKRSIGFLWVSAEELGLFGSQYYSENPVIPLNKTVAAINLDMVGRTRTPADTGTVMGEKLSILGGDSIGVIGGLQSKILMNINKQTLAQMNMVGDYTYNDPDNPERYFYRSDQINFVRHDIPVLFYSTGTHRDYHQVSDSPDKIDYEKLKKVTDFTYMVGYNIANYKGEIVVDNPFSKWGEGEVK
jgi:hypothetical protein